MHSRLARQTVRSVASRRSRTRKKSSLPRDCRSVSISRMVLEMNRKQQRRRSDWLLHQELSADQLKIAHDALTIRSTIALLQPSESRPQPKWSKVFLFHLC